MYVGYSWIIHENENTFLKLQSHLILLKTVQLLLSINTSGPKDEKQILPLLPTLMVSLHLMFNITFIGLQYFLIL